MKPGIIAVLTLLLFSCSDGSVEEPLDQNEIDTTKPKEYFPLLSFLKGEIRAVDSLPVGIKVYRTINGHTDSGYIKPGEFHTLAEEFLTPELEEEKFRNIYNESSFYDRGSKSSTFYYETQDQVAKVKRIDIITKATDTYDKVTSIFIEKMDRQGDSVIFKKLMWKPGQEFQVIEDKRVTRVVWQY